MNKHIAFVGAPNDGHVYPTLPLVEELVRRGYRVTYATGERLIPLVERAGATGLALPLSGMADKPQAGDEFSIDALVPVMEAFLAETRRSFPPLLAHFTADQPDAVCYDTNTFIGRMLAEKLGVPDIALVPFLAMNEQFGLQDLMKDASFAPDNPKLLRYAGEIAAFGAEYGLELGPMAYGPQPASTNLVLVPRAFQIAADTFDERYHFLGPQLGTRADERGWTPPSAGAPVLFVSFGTVWNDNVPLYRTCLEAFGDTPWHVVLAAGERTPLAELGPVPDNVEVHPSVPQASVLRYARVFLTHFGSSSVMEALYFGVPMVGLPPTPEHATNGRRVEELHLGRSLSTSDVTAAALRTAVQEVADSPEIRAALQRMRQEIQDYDGTGAGADVIEARL